MSPQAVKNQTVCVATGTGYDFSDSSGKFHVTLKPSGRGGFTVFKKKVSVLFFILYCEEKRKIFVNYTDLKGDLLPSCLKRSNEYVVIQDSENFIKFELKHWEKIF